jgi:hypothetical protein
MIAIAAGLLLFSACTKTSKPACDATAARAVVGEIEQARVALNGGDVGEGHDVLLRGSGAARDIAAASSTPAVKATWTKVADDLGIAALALGRGASAAANELINDAASKAREAANSCG